MRSVTTDSADTTASGPLLPAFRLSPLALDPMAMFKKLSRQISRLSIIDRDLSRETRWRRQIAAVATLPVTVNGAGDSMFPWASLRQLTDELLSKRTLSEAETDTLLSNLIISSGDRVVALAACAHHLSSTRLQEMIGEFNPIDSKDFLQAFVAASHGNSNCLLYTSERCRRRG